MPPVQGAPPEPKLLTLKDILIFGSALLALIALLILSTMSIVSADSGAGPGLTLDEVLTHVQAQQAQTHSLTFSFSETLVQGHNSQTINGQVAFKRPYQLRVMQRQPQKQTLWSDGKRFSLYSPDAEQVLEGDWKTWVTQTGFPTPLLGFVSDFPVDEWKTRYTVLFGGHDQGLYKVLFKPKQPKDAPLELWVSDSTYLPTKGRLTTPDARFDIDFKDYVMNGPVSDDLWTVHVPSGTARVPYAS